MRVFFLALAASLPGAAWAADPYASLCASNPAYSPEVMRSVVDAQLSKDHDPSLDSAPPDQIATEAVGQGIADCAAEMRRDPGLYSVLAALPEDERASGWDAYNTACDSHVGSKGACVTAEVDSMRALKRMVATNSPPGARTLVQTCQLVLKGAPAMADWRECVDQGLKAHAAPDRAAACKLSLPWHLARTGAEAGQRLNACLRGG